MRVFSFAILYLVSFDVVASTLDVARGTEIQLSSIAETLESFRADCGRLPSRVEFQALANATGNGCKSAHYLRVAQLTDHWGSDIVYENNNGGFNLLSVGRDRLRGSVDDIIYGVKERPWQLAYQGTIDYRDDFVDRWKNVLASTVAITSAAAIVGLILRRRYRRKPQ